MTWAATAAGVVAAGSAAYGASQQNEANKDAIGQQRSQSSIGTRAQNRALDYAKDESAAYRMQGQAALPLLQYLATGVRPQAPEDLFTAQDRTTLQDLAAKKKDMVQERAMLAADTTGKRKYQRMYNQRIAEIDASLSQLEDLERRKVQYDSISTLGGIGEGFVPESTGREYLGQMRDYKLDLDNDPIYQAQRSELERVLGRKYSSMGLNNSSAAGNTIAQNMVPLMENSYSRGYNKLSDLFGKQNALSQQQFAKITGMEDSGRYGTTLATNAALGVGSGISSAMQNPSVSNLIQSGGAAQNQNIQTLGSIPLNALATYNTGKETGAWGNDDPTVPRSTYSATGPYASGYQYPAQNDYLNANGTRDYFRR